MVSDSTLKGSISPLGLCTYPAFHPFHPPSLGVQPCAWAHSTLRLSGLSPLHPNGTQTRNPAQVPPLKSTISPQCLDTFRPNGRLSFLSFITPVMMVSSPVLKAGRLGHWLHCPGAAFHLSFVTSMKAVTQGRVVTEPPEPRSQGFRVRPGGCQ